MLVYSILISAIGAGRMAVYHAECGGGLHIHTLPPISRVSIFPLPAMWHVAA